MKFSMTLRILKFASALLIAGASFAAPMTSLPAGNYQCTMALVDQSGAVKSSQVVLSVSADGASIGDLTLEFNADGSCSEKGSLLAKSGTCLDGDVRLSNTTNFLGFKKLIVSEEYQFKGDVIIVHSSRVILNSDGTSDQSRATSGVCTKSR